MIKQFNDGDRVRCLRVTRAQDGGHVLFVKDRVYLISRLLDGSLWTDAGCVIYQATGTCDDCDYTSRFELDAPTAHEKLERRVEALEEKHEPFSNHWERSVIGSHRAYWRDCSCSLGNHVHVDCGFDSDIKFVACEDIPCGSLCTACLKCGGLRLCR